jgi:hypothetical protein
MTNDELRVVLAKWAGYNIVDGFYAYPSVEMIMARVPPEVFKQLSAFGYEEIPNYPQSLDSVATLEARLTDEEHHAYRRALWDVVAEDAKSPPSDRAHFSATAEQRCRALALALNLSL